jgi:hypothetical protein
MKRSPKDTLGYIQRITSAWSRLRPRKAFGGLTLAEYEAIVQPSLDTRAEIVNLLAQLDIAIARRNLADDISFAATQRVVNGVRGDREEGEDSILYGAMGYVRTSQRRSGLTQRVGRRPRRGRNAARAARS